MPNAWNACANILFGMTVRPSVSITNYHPLFQQQQQRKIKFCPNTRFI